MIGVRSLYLLMYKRNLGNQLEYLKRNNADDTRINQFNEVILLFTVLFILNNICTYVYAHLWYDHMCDKNSFRVIDRQSTLQYADYRLDQSHRIALN